MAYGMVFDHTGPMATPIPSSGPATALELPPACPATGTAATPFATHYLDALSSVFPDGEAFFVRSVLRYRDRIDDPELRRAIQGFAGQEGQHSHQHDRHLALLSAHGYGAFARANRVADRVMRFTNRRAPRFSLASTAALEHLTALLARRILADDARFTAADGPAHGRALALARARGGGAQGGGVRRPPDASRRATRCAFSRSS